MRLFAISRALVLLLSFNAATCFAQRNPSYVLFDVPGSASTYPTGINNSGDVTGYYCLPGESGRCEHGFVREKDGEITTFQGLATSINDGGAIAGFFRDPVPHVGYHCFLRERDGKMTIFDVPSLLELLGNGGTFGAAINNEGDITGFALDESMSDLPHGFVRDQSGGITTFEIFHGAIPTGISASGIIVGHTDAFNGPEKGFVRDRKGNITIFTVPGADTLGSRAHVTSVNNRGDVAGYFYSYVSNPVSAGYGFVRDKDGSFVTFGAMSNATETFVSGINEKGDAVGTTYGQGFGVTMFLRDRKGNITLINAPAGFVDMDPDEMLYHHLQINNRGDITGNVRDSQGTHGFVGSIVP